MSKIKTLSCALAILSSVLLFTSCTDDDDFGDIQSEIFYNLTSVTWFAEDSGYDYYDREFYSCEYWDFYSDGTGVYDTYLEVAGYPPEKNRYYFDWDFTTDNFAVIGIYMHGSGTEFWQIYDLTPYQFSSYVSNLDPVYNPGVPSMFQKLYALEE